MASNIRQVKRYYHSLESVLGYRFMIKGVKHFGLHADPSKPMSIAAAQIRENDIVAKAFGASPNMQVLECGCGEGSAANYIADTYGSHVTGIDLLPRNIARAKKEARQIGNSNIFLIGDYMALPFPENSFDAVYAMETLVHSPDAAALFKGIRKVLKPGGKLVFCEYSMTPRSKLSPKAQIVMTKMNTLSSMPALESFTTGAFPKILDEAGFKDIKVVDMTDNFLPTLEYFWKHGRRPYKVIRKLGLENHFVNAYSAVNIYELNRSGEQTVQYNLVTAIAVK